MGPDPLPFELWLFYPEVVRPQWWVKGLFSQDCGSWAEGPSGAPSAGQRAPGELPQGWGSAVWPPDSVAGPKVLWKVACMIKTAGVAFRAGLPRNLGQQNRLLKKDSYSQKDFQVRRLVTNLHLIPLI